ncbi:MAG: hypothetical protein PHI83_10095 [Sphaerochaetaceae bacterium]|nr:hypothetical protein [Sphaerochaetaceae bacterium]
MKKPLFVISLLLVVLLLFVSCATAFDSSLLQPTGQRIDPLLPNLEISNSSVETTVVDSTRSIGTNSYMYTIWQRELENNICDSYGEKQGRIEMTIANATASTGGEWLQTGLIAAGGLSTVMGITFYSHGDDYANKGDLSAPLCLSFGIAGLALSAIIPVKTYVDLDVEVRIYNGNDNQVWKKQYVLSKEFKDNYYTHPFDSDVQSLANDQTNKMIECFKMVIENIKSDLQNDCKLITSRLEANL